MFHSYEDITEKAFSLILSELEKLGFQSYNLWCSAYSADTFTTFCGVRADLLPTLCTALNGNYSNIARVIITDDYQYTADIDVSIMKDIDGNYYLNLIADNGTEKDERTLSILEKVNQTIKTMYM